MSDVRVRIAPSPTGLLHVGTARTALFNYLFAQKQGGKFILRIEDTDLERSDKKYEKDILEGLEWLGIEADESPIKGGPHGPYRQSERIENYKKWAEKLLKEGRAFYCFHSEEELEEEKEKLLEAKRPPLHLCEFRNMDSTEVDILKEAKKNYIIRFKTRGGEKITFQDLIRGELSFDSSLLGDFSIAKDVDVPLYNFAVVVDDYEMKISHVIRGEDHISNTPKQILLLEALGFTRPQYAHLPLILGSDRSKLSKRHGATSVEEYREAGYLPEALFNFLALLGWNPATKILTAAPAKTDQTPKNNKTGLYAPAHSGQQQNGQNLVRGKSQEKEREIFSKQELINLFSLEKVQKSGAVFDVTKLDWMNGEYIRKMEVGELLERAQSFFPKNKKIKTYLSKVLILEQPRLKKLSELKEKTDYFFQEPEYDRELLRWKNMSENEISGVIDKLIEILLKTKDAEKDVMGEAEKAGDRGRLLWPLRVALSGKKASPGPFEIMEIIGLQETIIRLQKAKQKIK